MIAEMGAFELGRVRRGALVAAALMAFARSGGAADAGAPAADARVPAAADGAVDAARDGGPIVDTFVDPGCGCRMSRSTNDARVVGVAAALLALAARRRTRVRHSLR
jgi:MYXO-CTERM domain-containing protein